MNFLSHSFLSFGNPGILAGNMMGDFVKGLKALEAFPEDIKNGILLHRRIDAFTDAHPATLKAKNIFRPQYRLYSGAFVDNIYDHFLANDPRYFPGEKALFDFTKKVYADLSRNIHWSPPAFARMFFYMESENWLFHYRTFKGVKHSFGGLVRRAQYLEEWDVAFELFIRHYYELNQLYYDFIEDIIQFVKKELNGLSTSASP
jgi:acyl carrier protein phosphodiesterase